MCSAFCQCGPGSLLWSWIPATHETDCAWVPSSQLSLASADVGIWTDTLCIHLTLFLCLSNKSKQTHRIILKIHLLLLLKSSQLSQGFPIILGNDSTNLFQSNLGLSCSTICLPSTLNLLTCPVHLQPILARVLLASLRTTPHHYWQIFLKCKSHFSTPLLILQPPSEGFTLAIMFCMIPALNSSPCNSTPPSLYQGYYLFWTHHSSSHVRALALLHLWQPLLLS